MVHSLPTIGAVDIIYLVVSSGGDLALVPAVVDVRFEHGGAGELRCRRHSCNNKQPSVQYSNHTEQ